ncbi:hypothetical protein HAU32_10560 [Weissella confusa]|uniref:Uncharacterized protein n=1 Tax=Weissella fermenti TaxID=2987699 RepID=A0ABT6D5C2_9LACO|nr:MULTISPECIES: hypothetical protein [Weissella]MBJ7689385.1 hypothetical protein [Weissella confusa]MCW0928007.1 hypothetical protein [Weissella sp. LMG 11983]MDF9300597.1 hypothetical protein [Weissella sp. BK2]
MMTRRDKYLLGLLVFLIAGAALLTVSAVAKNQASHKTFAGKRHQYQRVQEKTKSATKLYQDGMLATNNRDQETADDLTEIQKQGSTILDSLGKYKSAKQYNQNRTDLAQRLGAENATALLPNDDDGTGHSYIDTMKLTSYMSDKQSFVSLNDLKSEDTNQVYLIGTVHGGHLGDEKRSNSVGVPVLYAGSYNSKTQDFDKVNRVARLDEKFSSDLNLGK